MNEYFNREYNLNERARKENEAKENSKSDFNSDVFALAGAMTVVILRKTKSISQGEAALASGITQSYLSNVEKAKNVLSMRKLLKIANSLTICYIEALTLYVKNLKTACEMQTLFYENREDYRDYESFLDYARKRIIKDLKSPNE